MQIVTTLALFAVLTLTAFLMLCFHQQLHGLEMFIVFPLPLPSSHG